jgi:hypothetical protein
LFNKHNEKKISDFIGNSMKTAIILIVLLALVWVVCARTSRRQEHFAVSEKDLKQCFNFGEKDEDKWKPWEECYKKYGGPNEQDQFLQCARAVKGMDEQTKKACLPQLDAPAAGPSPASGDYNMSATMYDLFSQIAPMDMVKTMKENFVNQPSQEYVSGVDKLGTLYGSPYSNTYEGFSNSGHQMARLCVGDPYGTCRRKYGTSAWQGYSQCVLTDEGLQPPY